MSVISEMTFPAAFSQYTTLKACHTKPDLDTAQLACEWKEADNAFQTFKSGDVNAAQAIASLQSFLRLGQDMLSGTASNYDLNKMYIGIGIVILAVVFASISVLTAGVQLSMSSIALGVIMLSYGATMFASSYVEEEHQFWYWASGGWLLALQFKQ